MKIRTIARVVATVASASVFFGSWAGYAATASAADAPQPEGTILALPWGPSQEMEFWLRGVTRQDLPGLIGTANLVCSLLHEAPNRTGKELAFAALGEAGYHEGYVRGYALGTMVRLNCPDMLYVIK